MSPTHKLSSTLLRYFFALNIPRNFFQSSRNFYKLNPTTVIHTLIRPISVISVSPQSVAVVRGRRSRIAGVSTMASGGGNGGDSVTFQLTPASLLKIQKGDITRWSIDGSSDAIVSIKCFCLLYMRLKNLAESFLVWFFSVYYCLLLHLSYILLSYFLLRMLFFWVESQSE